MWNSRTLRQLLCCRNLQSLWLTETGRACYWQKPTESVIDSNLQSLLLKETCRVYYWQKPAESVIDRNPQSLLLKETCRVYYWQKPTESVVDRNLQSSGRTSWWLACHWQGQQDGDGVSGRPGKYSTHFLGFCRSHIFVFWNADPIFVYHFDIAYFFSENEDSTVK